MKRLPFFAWLFCALLSLLLLASCAKKTENQNASADSSEELLEVAENAESERLLSLFVNAPGGVELKSAPSEQAAAVCTLKDKQPVTVLVQAKGAEAQAVAAEVDSAETWLNVKTESGETGFVLSRFIEDSLEMIDLIRRVEGSYNESGTDSDQKITIKYIGNQRFEVDANWRMFQSKNLLTAEEIEKSDFLCRSGSRDGVQVDYKLHFDGSGLQYDFIGQYWDLDKDGEPANRRESRISTTLKKIE